MGYMSDVAMVMPKKEYDNMLNILKGVVSEKLVYPDTTTETANKVLSLLKYADVKGNAKTTHISGKKEDVVYLMWHYIKWYDFEPDDCYSDVRWLMKYLRGLKLYEYIRIGEEYDDIEIEQVGSNYDAVLEFHRDIKISEYCLEKVQKHD